MPSRSKTSRIGRRLRGKIPHLPNLATSHNVPLESTPPYASPRSAVGTIFRRHKTISTYDPQPSVFIPTGNDNEYFDEHFMDAKVNGVRVWYSSFTSVDWLHDAIKESIRVYRLRTRRSLRGQLLNVLDRSIPWLIVTVIGFLTAIAAFLIIRSEQWLFDLKEGHCKTNWWLARRFCPEWEEWSETLESRRGMNDSTSWFGSTEWALEYLIYICVAVSNCVACDHLVC